MIISDLIWKPLAIGALICVVVVGVGTGFGWWLAARDRDQAKVDLKAEQALSAQCRDAISEQNRAVQALADQKTLAEERGAAAQQLAAANGKRFDQALANAAGAKATTCTEAMPTVDTVLEAIR